MAKGREDGTSLLDLERPPPAGREPSDMGLRPRTWKSRQPVAGRLQPLTGTAAPWKLAPPLPALAGAPGQERGSLGRTLLQPHCSPCTKDLEQPLQGSVAPPGTGGDGGLAPTIPPAPAIIHGMDEPCWGPCVYLTTSSTSPLLLHCLPLCGHTAFSPPEPEHGVSSASLARGPHHHVEPPPLVSALGVSLGPAPNSFLPTARGPTGPQTPVQMGPHSPPEAAVPWPLGPVFPSSNPPGRPCLVPSPLPSSRAAALCPAPACLYLISPLLTFGKSPPLAP